jgi:hypothetical protein
MTTPNDTPDPLKSLMDEAQLLMNEMEDAVSDVNLEDQEVDEEAARELMDSIVIDGFAIDSDDEAEESVLVDKHDKKEESKEKTQQEAEMTPTAAAPSPNGLIHPLQEGLAVSTEQTTKQTISEDKNSPKSSSSASPLTSSAGASTTAVGPPSSASSPSLDAFRSKTSQFATNIANFAQKAASQVAAATTVPEPKMPVTSLHNIPTVELDNETKTQLIKTYIGDLLPGERVIMFLNNLLHVSDSSLNDYSLKENDGMWCCCMTYYRILLFCTASNQNEMTMPSSWNSSAWFTHTKRPNLLQMPLGSMDRVEKSVYATTGNQTLMGLVIHG